MTNLTGGPAAYAEARILLETLNAPDADFTAAGHLAIATEALAWAKLAEVALLAESDPEVLVSRPSAADPELGEPAYPGSPWGRAIYGDPT